MDRDSTTYLLWNMLIWGGADRVIYTVTITMLRTLSTLAVLIWWPGSDGAWLVVILLAITHVGHVETVKRTAARVVGTVIGAAAAAVSVTIITTGAVLVGVGLILVVAAVVIRMGSHYWLYMLTAIFVRPRKVGFPERIHRANGLSPSASAGPSCGGQDQQEGHAGEPGDERLGDAEGPELRVLAAGARAMPFLL